ncbi:MAG: hypothetical protein NTZ74_07630 [Chloroflexi bacterium]|nr:hypothetical protein [Chloroflexota bacterium]
MNKILLGSLIVAVLAIGLVSTGVVHAQSNTPSTSTSEVGYGMGGHGNRGGLMGGGVSGTQDGLLHDKMIAVFAEKLGITVEDLNTRLANGETLSSIALSQGMTIEQFNTLMVDARNQAIDQAVKDGTLTQTQADWMKNRGNMMGSGTNNMHGANGFGGQYANGSCPYVQTNP